MTPQRTARQGNPNQYLQLVRRTWYVRVKVPRTLEKYIGQTHIRQSLQTRDIDEANRLKHRFVAEIKATLEQQGKQQQAGIQPVAGISFADAKLWRDAIEKAQADHDHSELETLEHSAADTAAQVERLYGHDKAAKWFKAATVTTPTLRELCQQWLSLSDYTESTKAGRRLALEEVLAFIKDEAAHPTDINRTTAVSYIESSLTQRGLAYHTLRDRLASLVAFWKWIASRGLVSREANPWTEHRLSRRTHKGTRPDKRAYTDAELIALLKGTPTVKAWPTYSYLPDLIVLGMFTGAREEEICSLTTADIQQAKGALVINVKDAKTQAGNRPVAVTHPAPLAVLKRRLKAAHKAIAEDPAANGQLFPELKRGGIDSKLSSSAVKAFTRYRRACGVTDGADFHSFRRTVITRLEHAGVRQVLIARYVGHKVGTLAADTYSTGGSVEQSIGECQIFCVRGARRLVHGGGRRLRRTTDAVVKSVVHITRHSR